MKNAVSRQRGVEHDIVQRPQETDAAPYYEPQHNEVTVFEAAAKRKLPVMLKGPTGCGKTRFLEYMSWRLKRALVTVSCHEDLTSSDLVGRFLLEGATTVWQDGPLTRAVKAGAICYLDEIVEARTDSTVVIHSLTDHRRVLPIEKTGELLTAHPDFLLVISYNPGYQSVLKDLKPSTRQRFVTLPFGYPPLEAEATVIAHEGGIDAALAHQLALLGAKLRRLEGHGQAGQVGTRLLVYAAQLVAQGIAPRRAVEAAVTRAVGGEPELQQAITELADVILP
jgi:nitric oxide reductase NorQ protein